MIYLASPYSDPDPQVEETRFRHVCAVASKLMRAGHNVFAPIAHSHPIALAGGLPKDWDFWKAFDEHMIRTCRFFWVLTMPGWDASRGVRIETEIARRLGRTLWYIHPNTLRVTREPMGSGELR